MTNFKNIPQEEKPRERFLKNGVNNINNAELLSIILKTGTKNKSVQELSIEILSKIKNISELKKLSYNDLITVKGIGPTKAIELLSSIELGKRIYSYKNIKKININNVYDIVNYFYDKFVDIKQEEFHILYLDSKNNLLSDKLLFLGTVNMSIVHPREVFKNAYLLSASKMICIHNHPSGDSTPSKEDINLTLKIKELSIIHDIKLLDHIIIGCNNYYSFYENNKI